MTPHPQSHPEILPGCAPTNEKSRIPETCNRYTWDSGTQVVFFADPVKLVLMAKAKKTSSALAVTKLLVLEVLRGLFLAGQSISMMARWLQDWEKGEFIKCSFVQAPVSFLRCSNPATNPRTEPRLGSIGGTYVALFQVCCLSAVCFLLSAAARPFSPCLIGHPSRTVAFSNRLQLTGVVGTERTGGSR
jgi:hypothetical protein